MDSAQQHLSQNAGAVETARLMELLDRAGRALHRHQPSATSQEGTTLLSLRMAREKAVTSLLRLSAQASELARTQGALLDARRQLEAALAALGRPRSSEKAPELTDTKPPQIQFERKEKQ